METSIYAVVTEAFRVLLLAVVPLAAALCISGLVASALQSATAVHEEAIQFGVKLAALVGVGYLFLPRVVESVVRLAELALR